MQSFPVRLSARIALHESLRLAVDEVTGIDFGYHAELVRYHAKLVKNFFVQSALRPGFV